MVDLSTYNRENALKAVRNPSLAINHIMGGLKGSLKKPLEQLFYRVYDEPVDVMNESWDNLVILDACRHDIFKTMNTLDGQTSRAVSPASSSGPFIEHSFQHRQLHDTIYVTGNAHAHKISDEGFLE